MLTFNASTFAITGTSQNCPTILKSLDIDASTFAINGISVFALLFRLLDLRLFRMA
jgi:hypothetical protein